MANDTVDMLLEELTAQEVEIAPRIEGHRDAERFLVKPEEAATKGSVNAHIAVLQQRLDLIDTAKKALTALSDNGFDAIPDLLLPDDQFLIFEENHRTHEAAFAHTKSLPPPAVGGSFALSEGVDKDS